MIIGFVAGVVSALGFIYLNPLFKRVFNMHDTCGVHFLHGIPGFLGGIISAIACARAGTEFGEYYNDFFSYE